MHSYFIMIFSLCIQGIFCSSQIDPTLPREVHELAQSLQEQEEVVCVAVDGLCVGTKSWPCCKVCNQIHQEKLAEDPLVMQWYDALNCCRSSEHHELLRLVAWLSGPLCGGAVGYGLGECFARGWNHAKLLSVPLACFAALQAAKLNTCFCRWFSNILMRRADRAAFAVCATHEDREHIIAHLQKRGRNVQKNGSDFPMPEAQEYQLFSVSGYDLAQSNVCSFITINVKFPAPWLPTEGELQKQLQQRIDYLKKAC